MQVRLGKLTCQEQAALEAAVLKTADSVPAQECLVPG